MAQEGTLFNALTSGSKIVGNITADKDIRIDGTVEGDIQCNGKIVVGNTGFIKGSISCQNAEVLGKIDGKITVAGTLALRASSSLHGEAVTKVLIVEPNSIFNGTCAMGAEEKKK